MNWKIWRLICLLLTFYFLKFLIDDFSAISFILVEPEDDLYQIRQNVIFCFHFDELKSKDKLNQFLDGRNWSANLNVTSTFFLKYAISTVENNLNMQSPFRLNKSFTNEYFVCFLIEEEQLESNAFIWNLTYNYHIRLYLSSSSLTPYFYNYVYFKNPEILKPFFLKLQRQKVFGSNYLKSKSACSIDNQFKKSRFKCLNDCFEKKNIDFAWHGEESTKIFDLSLISKKLGEPDKKKEILDSNSKLSYNLIESFGKENFIYCIKKCPEEDCYFEVYNTVRQRDVYYRNVASKKGEPKIFVQTKIYLACYATKDFWLQIFGLLTLFTDTYVVKATPDLILLIGQMTRLTDHLYFQIFFFKLKKKLYTLFFAFGIYLSFKMINDYALELHYPNLTTVVSVESFESHSNVFVICAPIEILMYGNESFEDQIVEGRNKYILSTFTSKQIEEKTRDKYYKIVNSSVLYAFGEVSIVWKIKYEKISFKEDEFDNRPLLTRCFYVEPRIASKNFTKSRKYQDMVPFRTFYIKFKTRFRRVYLVQMHEELSSEHKELNGEYFVSKFSRKNSISSKKSNCKNYEKYKTFKCTQGASCRDKCISMTYFEIYKNLTTSSIINEDILKQAPNAYFVNHKDKKIKDKCFVEVKHLDCYLVYFSEGSDIVFGYSNTTLEINFDYESYYEKEQEKSLIKLVLDIISLEVILFGTDLRSIFYFLFLPIKRKFGLSKGHSSVVLILCAIGFLIHNVFVFKAIIQDSLLGIQYNVKLQNPFKLPSLIYCFPHLVGDEDENNVKYKIDKNYAVTNKYLDGLTKANEFGNFFALIWYFNR